MQLEWNRWLDGLSSFKEEQGLLLLFCVVVLGIWLKRAADKERAFVLLSTGLCVLVFCPFSAVVLLKGYTPFYDWLDLQLIFPSVLLLSYGGMELLIYLFKTEIPGLRLNRQWKGFVACGCIVILLLAGTTFHAFDRRSKADENGVPVEVSAVLKSIREEVGEHPLVLAAPSKILLYTRLFEDDWIPLYGQDLWSPKAASYINSGYEVEYQYYELLEKEWLEQEEFRKLEQLLLDGPAECVIVPSGWITEMELLADWQLIEGNDFYTGIIKKDLVTE